ncbi:hypothetical protein AB7M41_004012 [Bradyrhizobium diazoefficiens]
MSTWVPQWPMVIVVPSGVARATRAPAMLPEAPATFSTTTVVCSSAAIRSDRMRASVSVGPPAANGTTSVMGRDGKGWAPAGAAAAAHPINTPMTIR